jgi:hypothetical protein
MPYAFLHEEELDYVVRRVAMAADRMEQFLEPGEDIT